MRIKIIKNGSLKKIIGTSYWQVTDSYIFELFYLGEKYIIEVYVGFITNLGSIPSIFFFFDKSKYISYILHDFLYSLKGEIKNINGKINYDQTIADEILITGLNEEGMNQIRQYLIFIGLIIAGKYNYKKRDLTIEYIKNKK